MNQTNNTSTRKIVEPKIYGLLLESPETVFLSVQCAYSLEDAIVLAKLEFEKQNSVKLGGILNPLIGAKVGLYAIKTVKELLEKNDPVEKVKDLEVTPSVAPNEKTGAEKIKLLLTEKEKNLLMKEIVVKKDMELFKKNHKMFSNTEIKYLKAQLK